MPKPKKKKGKGTGLPKKRTVKRTVPIFRPMKGNEYDRKVIRQQFKRATTTTWPELLESERLFLMAWSMKNGKLARNPSRLRWLEEADDIIERLAMAREIGEDQFEELAYELAEDYQVPLHEVYTLFWSH